LRYKDGRPAYRQVRSGMADTLNRYEIAVNHNLAHADTSGLFDPAFWILSLSFCEQEGGC